MEKKNWALVIVFIISVILIAFFLIISALTCNFYSVLKRTFVNRSDNMITINYYVNNKLSARLNYGLNELGDRRTLRLFRENNGSGRTEDLLIVLNSENNTTRHFYIDGAIHDCSEDRNRQMCSEATELFRIWEQSLNAETLVRKSMESETNSFDFLPYFPSDDCNP